LFYQIIMADIVFRVHNLFYPFIRCGSALYTLEEHAERKKRPDHHAEIRRKRNQLSQRDLIRQNHLCTKDDREKVTRSADEHDRRSGLSINLSLLQLLFYSVLAQHLEVFLVTLFLAERLCHFDACDTFLRLIIQFTESGLCLSESAVQQLAVVTGQNEHERQRT